MRSPPRRSPSAVLIGDDSKGGAVSLYRVEGNYIFQTVYRQLIALAGEFKAREITVTEADWLVLTSFAPRRSISVREDGTEVLKHLGRDWTTKKLETEGLKGRLDLTDGLDNPAFFPDE